MKGLSGNYLTVKLQANSLEVYLGSSQISTQPAFTYSKITIETLEQRVKSVQS